MSETMPDSFVAIALDNPKQASNVGSVLRACGCYQANQVFYSGERYNRARKFATDTKNALQSIPLTHLDDLRLAKPSHAKLVCIELVENAIPLPEFEHPEHALYAFGPEDGSLKQQLIDAADYVVYVPTKGCMNLAATVNVLLYDRLAKSQSFATDNQLIRNSRDNNNNLIATLASPNP